MSAFLLSKVSHLRTPTFPLDLTTSQVIFPPSEILFEWVSTVTATYGPLKTQNTIGSPCLMMLLGTLLQLYLRISNVVLLCRFDSGLPHISLYFTQGYDKYGFMWYKCC